MSQKTKYNIIWLLVNGFTYIAFILGNVYELETLLLLSTVVLWSTAILGVLYLSVIIIFRIIFPTYFGYTNSLVNSKKNSLIKIKEKNIYWDDDMLCSLTGSREFYNDPHTRNKDIIIDAIIIIFMIYFNYSWLPFMYTLHILGYILPGVFYKELKDNQLLIN